MDPSRYGPANEPGVVDVVGFPQEVPQTVVVAVQDGWELQRRLRERRNRERQGWAHLGSVWIHMLSLFALGTLGPVELAKPPPPIELVMLVQGPASGQEQSARYDGTPTELSPYRYNPGLMEGDGDGLGLGTGAEDRGHEYKDPSDDPRREDQELFVREAEQAPRDGERPDRELPRIDEPEPSDQALAAAQELEQPDAVAEAEAPDKEAQEPEDAAAPPEVSPEVPEKAEEVLPPEEEEEEEPEEEPEEPDDAFYKRFVRSNEDQAGARPDDAGFIAAFNLEDPEIRRAIVDAEQWGPRAHSVQGTTFKPKERALNMPDGDPVEQAGNLNETEEAEEANAPESGGGGGQKGNLTEKTLAGGGVEGRVSGTPTSSPAEARRPTTPVAMRTEPVPQARKPSPSGRFKEAPRGEFSPTSPPDWWQPMAARVVLSPRPAAPPVPSPAAVVTEIIEEAAPEVREPRPEGETVLEEEGAEESSEEESPAESDVVAEVEDELEAEEPTETLVDTMKDLQEALGVGPRKQDQDNPRSNPDVNGQEGGPSASTQAVLDVDDPFAETVFVRAVADARGRYTEMLYRLVTAAWYKLDLPPHEKAIGVQGRVQVKFRVMADGTITDLVVSRSSGHPSLDAMALSAIPAQAPPFPDDLTVRSLAQRMTFRYRNPLIATSPK